MIVLEAAALTDTGRKRKINEDCFCTDDSLGLYAVADGMGGHAAGEVASRIAVDTFYNYMREVLKKTDSEMLPDSDRDLSKAANHLMSAVYLANQSVYDVAQGNPAYAGMGTTLSAVFFTDETFITANVGDSPVFLIRGGEMALFSTLHTVASEASAAEPEAKRDLAREYSHILTQAIGTKDDVRPDVAEKSCQPGDIILISSDGLTDMVPEEEILTVVRSARPAAACRQLVDLANEKGGQDNITVIVLRVKKIASQTGLLSRIKGWLNGLTIP